jgi:hypothetical protein
MAICSSRISRTVRGTITRPDWVKNRWISVTKNPFLRSSRIIIADEHGEPALVSRIEIELLSQSQFRWTLWAGDRRLISIVGKSDDVDAMVASNRTLVRMAMGLPPETRPKHSSLVHAVSTDGAGRGKREQAERTARAMNADPGHADHTWDAESVLWVALINGLDEMERRYCRQKEDVTHGQN